MTALSLVLTILLGGCGSSEPTESPRATPVVAPAAPEEAKGAKAKARAKAKAKARAEAKAQRKERTPVLRTGRFRIPVSTLATDEDVAAVQAAIYEAWSTVGGEPAEDRFGANPWKCRRIHLWDVDATEGPTPALRLFERLAAKDCSDHADDDAVERWEVSMRYQDAERADERAGGGEFRYLMSSHDFDHTGDGFDESFSRVYRRDGGKLEVAFPYDQAWLEDALPEELSLTGREASLLGPRWAVAKVKVGGEKITVEAERWDCADSGDEVGAEIVFRTNKRGPGHSTTDPKDVVITPKIRAFADAVVEALGDRAAGPGLTTEAALSCDAAE